MFEFAFNLYFVDKGKNVKFYLIGNVWEIP